MQPEIMTRENALIKGLYFDGRKDHTLEKEQEGERFYRNGQVKCYQINVTQVNIHPRIYSCRTLKPSRRIKKSR